MMRGTIVHVPHFYNIIVNVERQMLKKKSNNFVENEKINFYKFTKIT